MRHKNGALLPFYFLFYFIPVKVNTQENKRDLFEGFEGVSWANQKRLRREALSVFKLTLDRFARCIGLRLQSLSTHTPSEAIRTKRNDAVRRIMSLRYMYISDWCGYRKIRVAGTPVACACASEW